MTSHPTTSVDVRDGKQTVIRLRRTTVVSVDGDYQSANLTLSPGRWLFAEEKVGKRWTIRAAQLDTDQPDAPTNTSNGSDE